MRIIVVGAGALGRHLSQKLISESHEVVLIERDTLRAKELAESLDCTVISAEGTRPDVLEKAGIEEADAIVACTDHDQDNIIIGIVARDYGVSEIIIQTDDIQFHDIAGKIGFHHVINPPRIASVIIADVLRGVDMIELSSLIRGEVRIVSTFVASQWEKTPLSEIPVPPGSAAVGLYRGSDFIIAEKKPDVRKGDEIIVFTTAAHVAEVYRIGEETDEKEE